MNPHVVLNALQSAVAQLEAKKFDEARRICNEILAKIPTQPDALHILGATEAQTNNYEAATELIQRALQYKPNNPDYHNSLGNVYRNLGKLDDALESFQRCLKLRPQFPEAHSNVAVALKLRGRIPEAMDAFRKSVSLRPDFADAHWGLALLLLMNGDYAQGWKEYEWRWKIYEHRAFVRKFEQPRWDGSEVQGKSVLVYFEQGYGDFLQMIRYMPLVKAKGAKVVLECPKDVLRLAGSAQGVDELVTFGTKPPKTDLQIPLMSLPLIFGTTVETIPNSVPYLHADPVAADKWKGKLGPDSKLKVGLVWAGSPKNSQDRYRSVGLNALERLGRNPHVTLVSMQKGPAAEQAKNPPHGMHLIDCGDQLNDFADTAALISNLDLVITVETAVAHLAGAMNKPTWVLTHFVPDWRWMLGRSDSPWYPSMRLFRQETYGDWTSVVHDIARELADLANK